MNTHQVLARSLRPQTFQDMIGQDNATTILTNAIARDRIPNVLLLTGSRGTGKTTTARIWAKCLNCLKQESPITIPCNECKNCKKITTGRHTDICEVDAGSHTGSQEIQDLLEQAEFTPQEGRMRVCILDEVHMLSSKAFANLARTLNEQHPNIKFVLATTEESRIPQNIRSLALHIHLEMISRDQIQESLVVICQEQGYQITEPALAMLAICAKGSMRDALSLLERAGHNAIDQTLDLKELKSILGMQDPTKEYSLFRHICEGNIQDAILLAREIHDSGTSSAAILESIANTHHLVSMYKVSKKFELSLFEKEHIPELSTNLTSPTLKRFFDILNSASNEIKDSANPQSVLEIMLLRMIYISDYDTPERFLELATTVQEQDKPVEPRLEIKTTPTPDPVSEIKEVENILKAFPGAKITIKEK